MNLLAAREQQQLDHDGYLVLEGIVQPNRVEAMRERLEELHLVTEQKHRGTLIVGGLLEEEVFDAAWLHPRVLAAVRHVLGDGVRLTGVSSRGIQPGHGQQALHVDWSEGLGGEPVVWYGCHAICALVELHAGQRRDAGRPRVASQSVDTENPPRPSQTTPGPEATPRPGWDYLCSQRPLRTFRSPQRIERTSACDLHGLLAPGLTGGIARRYTSRGSKPEDTGTL